MSISQKSKRSQNYSLISRRVKQLSPSGIRKFFDLLASMEGVISLGVGEPDFVTPWHIREAAIFSLEQGFTMYTSNMGMPELRQGLSRYLADNYNLKYDPNSELLATVGVSVGRRECWGRGLGHEALCGMRDHCFEKLGLHRLEAKVSVYNSRSVRLFLHCGFIIEGHLRDSDIIDGEYHRGYLMGILESDRR